MYKHTQVGWVMIIAAAILIVVVPLISFTNSIVGCAIGVLIGVLFSSLTVCVDREQVTIRFGIGIIRKRILLAEVVSYKVVKNKWWWGWGIHGCHGKACLYNVSGFDSIELTMKNGMKYLIGTDEPDKLCGAIKEAKEGL